ncbi:hypothetical protein, conserved [Babesia bigemina]|uniref:ubiquitinyl hydrolase 1 n=1 Tax=Babesia bigemina TaxID=5866 RepID=A0A061DC87_BABBI|nr:hypothetical protein, conserved [Babesia bigemina]CDR95400.1 hypothetical protein, conserved [Babesia bigemina]|eukprot:XP_012767586.1 hypothetical protein, conserved [Babesia bigemina]
MENVVYWEKQDPQSKLCALHCLNSFLQGPKVTNDELLNISTMLGRTESALLKTWGNRSSNVGASGYRYDSDGGDFDVTVLIEALRKRNFICNYYTVNDMKLSMFQKSENCGFICNANNHWFCIRMLLADQWFILDSLRPGPHEVEYGQLYSYISQLLNTKGGAVFLVYSATPGTKLPVAEPNKFSHLQSHQYYLTSEEIKEMNKENDNDEENKSFLYRAGVTKQKPVVWPTTGGIRLDQSVPKSVTFVPVKDEEDYKEADSRTVAVKINGTTRITRRFDPQCGVNEVFKWVEKHIESSDAAFYTLLQTVPNRRFVKYTNGSIEMIQQNDIPRDIGNTSLAEAGFESHEMFMLRCD